MKDNQTNTPLLKGKLELSSLFLRVFDSSEIPIFEEFLRLGITMGRWLMDNLFSVLFCNWWGLHEGLGGWAGPVFFCFYHLFLEKLHSSGPLKIQGSAS